MKLTFKSSAPVPALTSILPIILAVSGNKKDLRESREITEQEGADLAAKYRCPYYESSALFDDNISPIFQVLDISHYTDFL